MDSLTHITLGACVGEILLSKKLGKKALIWGIIAQNLPDADSVASLFVSPDRALLIHRGITHSLLFALIAGVCLAFLAKKIHDNKHLPFAGLLFFFCFQLALHDVLDICNSYGTGLLEPFSHQRFSINLLYVADPLFTLSLLIASLLLAFKGIDDNRRIKWAAIALVISGCYLCFAGFNKLIVNKEAQGSFASQRLNPVRYFTTPAPFNCMLWYVVAAADSSYYTGYSSVWDNSRTAIGFEHYQRGGSLLKFGNRTVINNLIAFARGYYTVSKAGNDRHLNVLRFEQVQGWRLKKAPFAFSFPLSASNRQAMLLQKGRLQGWNLQSFKVYLKRIAGEQALDKQSP